MISIHELFENGELILQETLIDSIFKYIDYGGLEEKIDDDVLLVLRDNAGSKFEVDLQYRQNQDPGYKVLIGEYVKPNKILIYIPKNQKESIKYLADVEGKKVYEYKEAGLVLGSICGKPFVVSTLIILDKGKSKVTEIE